MPNRLSISFPFWKEERRQHLPHVETREIDRRSYFCRVVSAVNALEESPIKSGLIKCDAKRIHCVIQKY
ncbi:Uncharacterized protein APZ42_021569 [Daphnia magna]|uniref:Uncharacterized protein n=1 Tax=Daphnia magna TaxID=35525 RepID=A0A162CA54_9CRUS|nr:Uncharacterized protein APZ42_021569 [Daphnia magna]